LLCAVPEACSFELSAANTICRHCDGSVGWGTSSEGGLAACAAVGWAASAGGDIGSVWILYVWVVESRLGWV
jgi:hypothetical protein